MTPSSKSNNSLLKTAVFRLLIFCNFLVTFWFLFLLAAQLVKQNVPTAVKNPEPPVRAIVTLGQIK